MERDESSARKGYSADSYIATLEEGLWDILGPRYRFM